MRFFGSIACILFFSLSLSAQVSVVPNEYVDSLIVLARSPEISFLAKARYGEKALSIAKSIKYEEAIFDATMAAGIGHFNVSSYDKALAFFQDAYQKGREKDNTWQKAYAGYYLGNVKDRLSMQEESLRAFQESYQLFTEEQDTIWMGNVLNGLGIIHAKLNEFDLALEAFELSLDIFKKQKMEEYIAFPLSNIGQHYMENLNQPELALNYFEEALKIDQKFGSKKGEAISLISIGQAYSKMGQYNKAIEYFDQSLNIALANDFNSIAADNYKDLCDAYKAKGQLDKALENLSKYQMMRDTILNDSKNAQIADLQAFFENEQKEQDLKESREKIEQLEQQSKISYLWMGIFAVLILATAIISYLLINQNRTKRKLIETDLAKNELEREKLERELQFKNQDLTNLALDIARKNEFSNQVHEALKDIVDSNPQDARKKAREMLMTTANHLQINDDIKQFQMNIEKVNHDFFNKLNENFPDLTQNERHLCGLIRLNLSTKEIAVIRNISPKSVEMGRYRLRKKLDLDPKDDLTAFLQQL